MRLEKPKTLQDAERLLEMVRDLRRMASATLDAAIVVDKEMGQALAQAREWVRAFGGSA